MKSATRGKNTSLVEISHISEFGVWILAGDKEYFASYENFPWFKDATVKEIHNVKLLHGKHLYWPALDIDLSLESVEYPEKFPLVSRTKRKNSLKKKLIRTS